jgi:hypothetical protein
MKKSEMQTDAETGKIVFSERSLFTRYDCCKRKCNQQEWEKQGREGRVQFVVVTEAMISKLADPTSKIPMCPYCKKRMKKSTKNIGEFFVPIED